MAIITIPKKEDHLALVRLFYDLLVQQNMEPWMANKVSKHWILRQYYCRY